MMKRSDLADKIRRQQKAVKLAKKHFDHADQLLEEIACEMDIGQKVRMGEGELAVLKDNWAGKSKVFGHGASRRYEIEMVTG